MLNRLMIVSLGLLVSWAGGGEGLSRVWGQNPTKADLLQLVGDDAGLCVELTDLRQRLPRFINSAMFQRFQEMPAYTAWKQSREFQKLISVREAIERQTGQPLGQFAMSLFGESVVFAVYPREPDEPAGVLLLRATNEESLRKAVAVWNNDKRVQLDTLSLGNTEYTKRTETKRPQPTQGRTQFYFVKGQVFALSDDEATIQSIIRRGSGQDEQPALIASPRYQTARTSLPEDCFATLYFNPRSWNPGWEFENGKSRVEKWVANLWKRSEVIAAGLRADQGMSLDLVVHYDPADLPDRWRQLVERTAGFPRFLNQVPAGAFFVFAGKQDLTGIDQIVTAELDEKTRQQWQTGRQISRGLLLGLDLFKDVLPKFRPNWGVYVVPRDALDPDAVPVDGLLAIELPANANKPEMITVRKALENALNTGFNFLAAMQNSKSPEQPAIVKSEKQADSVVEWIENIGPYQPAYCLSSEYLIFASSPKLMGEFLSPTQSKLTESRIFQLWSARHNPPEGQLLFINWQAVRQFLDQHHAFLLKQAVESHALPREEAEKRLKRLKEVLQLLDGVYLGMQIQNDRIHLTLGGITTD